MSEFRTEASVRLTRTLIASEYGTTHARYAVPLDYPRLYKWIPGDTSTADGLAVLTHSGGQTGRWHLVRIDIKGDDLSDADASLTVAGNFLRVSPSGVTLTTDRTLTLSTTNAAAGDSIRVVRRAAGAFSYLVVNGGPGAGTLKDMDSADTWADFYFDDTNWILTGAGSL